MLESRALGFADYAVLGDGDQRHAQTVDILERAENLKRQTVKIIDGHFLDACPAYGTFPGTVGVAELRTVVGAGHGEHFLRVGRDGVQLDPCKPCAVDTDDFGGFFPAVKIVVSL